MIPLHLTSCNFSP